MSAVRYSLLLLGAVGVMSCGKKPDAAAMGAMPPAAVTVTPVISETVNVTRVLPGRVQAVRTAEVRARVPGILLRQRLKEGSEVKEGEVMFEIDPEPLKAALARAKAALAVSEASRDQAKTLSERYAKLADSKAVSAQEAENAAMSLKVAEAEVLSAEAGVRTAELNLGYATVTAPISGRVGKAQVTEGALVGQGDATRLAVIQQLDPVYFDFTQSSAELLELKRALAEGKVEPLGSPKTQVKLLLEDGSEYGQVGKVLFSEVTVDPSTGMVSMRAEFPNPDRVLLPGMFARVSISLAAKNPSLTVPQRSVTRMPGGAGSVMVVNASNHVEMRMIRTGDVFGNKWVVTDGLKAGEQVIVEGLMKARPGAEVKPSPFESAPAGKS